VDGPISLTGGAWNAPQQAGLLLLEAVDKGEFLLVGIEWERDWRYRIEKDADGRWLSIDLAGLSHDMAGGEALSTPRVFLGLAHGDLEQAFLTARRYLRSHVFPEPLKNWPWVVYDFWATDAEGVQAALLHEVEFAAKLGVDIFVHDASWYAGSSNKGTGDWGCGLGNYQDDREKFPMGLAAISQRVHASGMKFGLWVGPNVVDSRLVGTTIPKQWLARIDGKDLTLKPDGWESSVHQVCLGCREYLDFLKKELTRLVREYELDWLKWDNSGIPASPANCTRADHGHQPGDASYASLVGQYEIFDHLHSSFPDLILEQCGYGSRLDYGLARTIRSNWMSDASYPSESVRHDALVASCLYPSGDNGGWIVAEDKTLLERANDPAALDTIFRSRMLCLFGFGTLLGMLKDRISLFPEPVLEAARRNMAVFKRYRHLLQQDSYRLLDGAKDQPQAIQFVATSGDESVVMVFTAESKNKTVPLPLRGLRKNTDYEITFTNSHQTLQAASQDLLSKGIEVVLAPPVTSEVVLLGFKNSRG
jgi:alpha-galactosidase